MEYLIQYLYTDLEIRGWEDGSTLNELTSLLMGRMLNKIADEWGRILYAKFSVSVISVFVSWKNFGTWIFDFVSAALFCFLKTGMNKVWGQLPLPMAQSCRNFCIKLVFACFYHFNVSLWWGFCTWELLSLCCCRWWLARSYYCAVLKFTVALLRPFSYNFAAGAFKWYCKWQLYYYNWNCCNRSYIIVSGN